MDFHHSDNYGTLCVLLVFLVKKPHKHVVQCFTRVTYLSQIEIDGSPVRRSTTHYSICPTLQDVSL